MRTRQHQEDVDRLRHFPPGTFITPGHATRTRFVVLATDEERGLRLAALDGYTEPWWTWSRNVFKEA